MSSHKRVISFTSLAAGALVYCFFDSGLIRGYLPDLLWAFSYYLILSFYVPEDFNATAIVIVTGAVLELLQVQKIIAGTGDLYDVLVEILGVLLAIGVDHYENKQI